MRLPWKGTAHRLLERVRQNEISPPGEPGGLILNT